MSAVRHVLVSGAGIAGPVLAYFLAQAGIRVTVLERAPALLAQGQNIDIKGSAIVIMRKMGLIDELKRYNTLEKGTHFVDDKGRFFARMPVQEGIATSPTQEFEILRGDLAKVLFEATKDHPLIDYRFGIIIEKVLQNDEKLVKVQLSNGETLESDLLVAADGQWSRIRRNNFPQEWLTIIDKNMYGIYFTVPRKPTDTNWWTVYTAKKSRVVSSRPDSHGTYRAFLSLMPSNEQQKKAWQSASRGDRQTQEDLCRKEFGDAGWEAQRFLDAMPDADDLYFQAIQQIRLSKWSKDRIVCVGDAAYAPTPLSGMGTPLAINGAYTLAGELANLKEGASITTALEEYERKFRPFVTECQDIPSFIPSIMHPYVGWKRSLLWSFVSAFAFCSRTPLIINRFGGAKKNDDEDYPLPKYAAFEVTKGD
ncbi:FAD/NAD(P)-binding domain-containing protein [Ceraceosorus guamensis]|uniref:FAD/NAD(P)-binding domain-containing protein n=1 Tax=Ceraceosorus guamensis TaxID=1522189 RepID=A0A316W5S8_9BASI|nr:FAD/NAD(P)-binding domain-containing protein [Ceraceosorus guamensis]PWN45219.1 FAD/NAD(P)-binding domain-containing protein [Ceraceosorus guamensis]